MAACAALAALESFLALIIAAPLYYTVGIMVSVYHV
jgi:hypothetical protein